MPASTPVRPLLPEWVFDLFRLVALVEGVTTLLLFFVAMPVKYLLDDPSWVAVMGPVHGYAFLAYLVAMVAALAGRGWGLADWARTVLAAFLPFGTFLNEPFLRRRRGAASPTNAT
ncbi:DUF3817 domain-containing protein [Pseudogemmobacter sonorensis]|uniref:DUF3817 domain-containing protein n=1 Tax=Pseudogemmobacter sonorensis TaxID=2989681 RepID=UPI0036B9EB40